MVLRGDFSFFCFDFCDGGVMVNCFSKWLFEGIRGYAPLLPCTYFLLIQVFFSGIRENATLSYLDAKSKQKSQGLT